jgi:hypothetical protein
VTFGRLALVCTVGAAVLLALTRLLAVAPYATGDEPAHVDYAYQVWHGRLPVFEEGLELRPAGAWIPPVQWTAQHPPLYYLVIAPLVGPLADAGLPVAAVYAARGVSVLILGALVVAAWWSARQLAGSSSPTARVLPTVTAFVVACSATAVDAGASAYNDILAAALVTLLFGLVARAVRRGLDARLVAAISVVVALCALTRTSAMIAASVCGAAAVVAGLLPRADGRRHPRASLALVVAAPAAVAATSGWFYLRNVRLTGSVTGGHPDWAAENQNRVVRPVREVALDPVTWERLPNLFWWDGAVPRVVAVWVLLAVPALLGGVYALTAARRRTPAAAEARPDTRARRVLLAAFPVVAVVVAVTVQLVYVSTGGGPYPRSLLPVLLPFAFAVAAGLGRWPLAAVALPVWTAIVLVDAGTWLAQELSTPAEPGRYAALPGPAAVVGCVAGAWVLAAAVLVVLTTRRPRRPADDPPSDALPARSRPATARAVESHRH